VALLGQGLSVNGSSISAQDAGGSIALGVAQSFSVDFNGDGLINFAVVTPVEQKIPGLTSSLTVNNSTVQAAVPVPGYGVSQISIQALVDKDAVLDHVVNLGGEYYDTPGVYNSPTVGNSYFSPLNETNLLVSTQ
jgi:hypothetical protein